MKHYRCALIVAVQLWSGIVFGADDVLGPENWPTTVNEAVDDLLPQLSILQKSEIRTTSRDNLISLHFSLGLEIRNRYGLWRGNEKLIRAACGKPCHPDDASMKIIEAAWTRLRR
jgi:hypothetical protein